MRIALGVSYRGHAYQGWQSQAGGRTVQDCLEHALAQFADEPVRTVCAGRTDAGVHALNQVVHFDTEVARAPFSWVRGSNRFLPADIAVQWCLPVSRDFHARNQARGRRYRFVVLQSAVRPALESGLVGWVVHPLDGEAMERAVERLVGEQDFSSFRSAECQAASPVKTLRSISIARRGAYWRFDFDANAFLHHMVRNLVGLLLEVGKGAAPPERAREQLESRQRRLGAPTAPAHGLYFWQAHYPPQFGLPGDSAMIDAPELPAG